MAGNTKTTFALEVMGIDNHIRIFAEHAEQQFTISLVPKQLAEKMPERPIKPECQFDFQDAMNLACKGFVNDPSFGDDKDARKKLSGMVIYLASLMGLTDIQVQG